MALAKRVIPVLLLKGRSLVKGKRFAGDRVIGSPLQAARVHASRGVDELVLLDISATAEGRGPDLSLITELSTDCYIPITVGGGVKTLQDIDALLRAGADKVAICSAVFEFPELVAAASERFGSQAIVGVVDYKKVVNPHGKAAICVYRLSGSQHVFIEETGAPVCPHMHAERLMREGAGEILLQSVERDGTMQGYDLDLIREVSQSVSIPVIASGGCSGYEDMLAAFKAGADACAAGALFSFTDCVPKGAAKFLKAHGLEVRL